MCLTKIVAFVRTTVVPLNGGLDTFVTESCGCDCGSRAALGRIVCHQLFKSSRLQLQKKVQGSTDTSGRTSFGGREPALDLHLESSTMCMFDIFIMIIKYLYMHIVFL